jgi:hypothetical protein
MNVNLSFKERALKALEALAKQSRVTLEEAKKQAEWLKKNSTTKTKKRV